MSMVYYSIPVELGFLWEFELLKLKACSLYHENLFIQKFKVISSQRPFPFLWYECYLTTIPVELGFLWEFELLKLNTCSLYHENLL
jgi:hypothetical protein